MSDQTPGIIVVKEGVAIDAKQEIPYFVGVSARTAGASGISMQRVVIPPGGAARAHIHLSYETAIYIVQGQVETRYGPGLRESVINGPGEFIYIPADVPHQPRNLSDTEPAIAIVARNDADEQEHVIPYDPASE
ncbi:MAG TPA: cupin domain-containing protein [Ktedonobacterales bacterium]|nr:cupin domain-containing protein [Ktedonobacterales bacterium]